MKMTSTIKGFFVEKYNKAFLFFTDTLFRYFMYTSLFDLPLRNYIDVTVEGKYRKLLKLPILAPVKVYKAVYAELIEEYMQLSGNTSLKAEQERAEDESDLRKRIYLYSVGLSVLVQFEKNDGILAYFKTEGFEGEMEEVARRVDEELKVMNMELQAIEKLKIVSPKEKTTRADFSKTIAMACKNGYNVTYGMSVADFIQTLNLQREEIESLKRFKA